MHRQTRPRHGVSGRTAPGFTLIELLVVISLIMLLIALLLPALGAARDHGRLLVCKSNLRQIYIAIANYNTQGKRLPLAASNNAAQHLDWYRKILPYLNDDQSRYTCWDQGSINTWCYTDAHTQAKTVYRGNKVFVCPSNEYVRPGAPWGLGSDTYWVSYAGNTMYSYYVGKGLWPSLEGYYQNTFADFGGTKLAIVVEGTTAVNTGDLQNGYYFSNQHLRPPGGWGADHGTIFGPPLFHRMHAELNNFMVDDGRVVSRKFEIVPDGNFWSTYWTLVPWLWNPDW